MDKKELIAASRIVMTDYNRFPDALYQFTKAFWHEVVKDPFIDNWHIKFLCDEIQAWSISMLERKPKDHDMIINISPGESKSTICSVMLPAWLWTIDPTIQLITVSYNADLSIELAVKSKDIIQSDKYKTIFGHKFKIRDDQDSKAFFKNNKGGWRFATSVGAKVTGYHAHMKIMDDGNNPAFTSNPDLFEGDSNWYDTVYRNRNVEESITLELFVQQRVALNDITAHILGKSATKVRHIKIPATLEHSVSPPEIIKYYTDGLMNPKRRGWSVMNKIKSDVGDFVYDAQYGQEPDQAGGGLVADEDFEIIDAADLPNEFWSSPVFYFVDSAFKDKSSNDPTGILVCLLYDYDVYIVDFIDERLTYVKLKDRLKEIYYEYSGSNNNTLMYVEAASSGYAILAELALDQPINLAEYPKSQDSKISRFSSCTNIIKGRRIKLINDTFVGRRWNKKYKDILCKFPNVPHDEAVDTTVMAIDELIKKARNFDFQERKIIEFG
jgi:phage terminase large subunit-like protein